MTKEKVYVFTGSFNNIDEARLYTEAQWQPEPDESVSDEVYQQWENSNPTHQLLENIASYLDEDFIETIPLSYDYLASFKIDEKDIEQIKKQSVGNNVLVLVFESALRGFDLKKSPRSTQQLTYCGVFNCVL